MVRDKGFDEAVAVRNAREAFWERGYTATSLARLMSATGLNKSSLYETFGSKRELFGRAMQSYIEEVMGPKVAVLEAPGAGKPELVEFFGGWARVFRSPSGQEATRGCLLLNTATELNDLDEVAAEELSRFRLRIRAAMLNAARTDGDESTAQFWADMLTAAHIGMVITSRMDPPRAAEFADTLATHIASW